MILTDKKLGAVLLLCVSTSSYSAINDEYKERAYSAFKVITNDRLRCYEKAGSSAESNECLSEAYEKYNGILNELVKLRVKEGKMSKQEILNAYSDQILFKNQADNCDALEGLSYSTASFYSKYQCKIQVMNLYLDYL